MPAGTHAEPLYYTQSRGQIPRCILEASYFEVYMTPVCAAAFCTKLCAGRVSSISTLHVDPDQPNPRPDPNPNPNPSGGSRSAGAVTRLRRVFWWRFSNKLRAAEIPGLTNNTRILHSFLCRMQPHIDRSTLGLPTFQVLHIRAQYLNPGNCRRVSLIIQSSTSTTACIYQVRW